MASVREPIRETKGELPTNHDDPNALFKLLTDLFTKRAEHWRAGRITEARRIGSEISNYTKVMTLTAEQVPVKLISTLHDSITKQYAISENAHFMQQFVVAETYCLEFALIHKLISPYVSSTDKNPLEKFFITFRTHTHAHTNMETAYAAGMQSFPDSDVFDPQLLLEYLVSTYISGQYNVVAIPENDLSDVIFDKMGNKEERDQLRNQAKKTLASECHTANILFSIFLSVKCDLDSFFIEKTAASTVTRKLGSKAKKIKKFSDAIFQGLMEHKLVSRDTAGFCVIQIPVPDFIQYIDACAALKFEKQNEATTHSDISACIQKTIAALTAAAAAAASPNIGNAGAVANPGEGLHIPRLAPTLHNPSVYIPPHLLRALGENDPEAQKKLLASFGRGT